MNRRPEDVPGWFVAWFIFCAVLSIATLAFLAWAIYRLVVHFT